MTMHDEPAHTEKAHGCTIKVYHDECAESPRDWDNLGTMVCFHKRYDLGDKKDYPNNIDGMRQAEKFVHSKDVVCLPLYLFDHSGLSLSTSDTMFRACDSAAWDWGLVGWVYVTKEKIRQEYGCKHISKQTLAKVLNVLKGEVATYEQYLQGQVWGYVVENDKGEQVDSCWGYFGDSDDDNMLTEARNSAEYYTKKMSEAESCEGAGV